MKQYDSYFSYPTHRALRRRLRRINRTLCPSFTKAGIMSRITLNDENGGNIMKTRRVKNRIMRHKGLKNLNNEIH